MPCSCSHCPPEEATAAAETGAKHERGACLDDDVEVGLLASATLDTTSNIELGSLKSVLGGQVEDRSRSGHLVPLADNVELGGSEGAGGGHIGDLSVLLHAVTTDLSVHGVQLGCVLGLLELHGVAGLQVGLHAITTNLVVDGVQMRALLGATVLHGVGGLKVGLHAITTDLVVDGGQMRSLLGATVLHGVDGLQVGLHAITTDLGVDSGQMRSLLGTAGLHGIGSLQVLGGRIVLMAVDLALRLVGLSSVHVQGALAFAAPEALLVEAKVLDLHTLNGVSSLTASITLGAHCVSKGNTIN